MGKRNPKTKKTLTLQHARPEMPIHFDPFFSGNYLLEKTAEHLSGQTLAS